MASSQFSPSHSFDFLSITDTGSNFSAFLHLYDNEMLEDEEEFSWDEEKDELDDEYDRIQSVSQDRIKSLDEKIVETEQMLEKQIEEMDIARDLVCLFYYFLYCTVVSLSLSLSLSLSISLSKFWKTIENLLGKFKTEGVKQPITLPVSNKFLSSSRKKEYISCSDIF